MFSQATLDCTPLTRRVARHGNELVNELTIAGWAVRSTVRSDPATDDPLGDWWGAFLAGERPRCTTAAERPLRTMELFCGAGGLAVGFGQACAELGVTVRSEVAVDQDHQALAVYAANHATRRVTTASVSTIVDYQVRGAREEARFVYEPELLDQGLSDVAGSVDVLIAGPPCQGHSNLNNVTRRTDRRNELYLTVPALAVATGAQIVVVENVPAVVHDRFGVVDSTIALLETAGYNVTTGTLHAERMGWPQMRARHFLVARRDVSPLPLGEVATALAGEPRSILWAIEDLADATENGDVLMRPAELNTENRRRIDWLFDNDEFDLALSERPECHREGTRYTAVYGRLFPDQPARTITTGFMSPGQGRFVHPTRRRGLTAREAARLQGFPDSYIFAVGSTMPSRKSLAKWIGDAVPMPLGYAAGISALGPGWS